MNLKEESFLIFETGVSRGTS